MVTDMAIFRFTNIAVVILFILFYAVHPTLASTGDDSKEEPKFNNMEMETFQRNLSECASEVKASMLDVNRFMKRLPQETKAGKCFVACILKRNSLIENDKISSENLMASSRASYGDEEEVLARLELALSTCSRRVDHLVEVCEYASQFNDCMHIHMEHILDKLAMERRMLALGQTSADPDPEQWPEDEEVEEVLKHFKDEL